jgi:hypothetical protein
MLRALLALLLATVSAAPAAAQDTPATSRCRNEALPFPATEANRLPDDQLHALFAGKTLVYIRESTRVQGAFVRLGRELRTDGSMVSTCQLGRNRAGPWKNCQTYGSDTQRVAGHRDVGVWRVENRALCFEHTAFKVGACFAIHRQGGLLAAKNTRGPRHYCGEGPITVE